MVENLKKKKKKVNNRTIKHIEGVNGKCHISHIVTLWHINKEDVSGLLSSDCEDESSTDLNSSFNNGRPEKLESSKLKQIHTYELEPKNIMNLIRLGDNTINLIIILLIRRQSLVSITLSKSSLFTDVIK